MQKAIVLAADFHYCTQVMTTIKSIACHNHGIKYYVINSDFPNEWFFELNQHLKAIDSEVVNACINDSILKTYHTNISYAAFLRYFISELVEEERAIYLDCDIVVTGNLDQLFTIDLEDHYIAAVKDMGGQVYYNEHIFNSGMMVVNNKLWKAEQMTKKLIETTNELHDKVSQDDQSILNILFENRWLPLDPIYNYIGIHSMFIDYPIPEGHFPTVIHYLTHRKPWDANTASLYRDLWWYYYGLEWSEICQNKATEALKAEQVPTPFTIEALIFTSSNIIEHIDYLAQQLPQVHFTIAALSNVADNIPLLLKYPNVSVAAGLIGLHSVIEDLIQKSDVLLDIHRGEEIEHVISKFQQLKKPILAFDSTAKQIEQESVFALDAPETMKQAIEALK